MDTKYQKYLTFYSNSKGYINLSFSLIVYGLCILVLSFLGINMFYFGKYLSSETKSKKELLNVNNSLAENINSNNYVKSSNIFIPENMNHLKIFKGETKTDFGILNKTLILTYRDFLDWESIIKKSKVFRCKNRNNFLVKNPFCKNLKQNIFSSQFFIGSFYSDKEVSFFAKNNLINFSATYDVFFNKTLFLSLGSTSSSLIKIVAGGDINIKNLVIDKLKSGTIFIKSINGSVKVNIENIKDINFCDNQNNSKIKIVIEAKKKIFLNNKLIKKDTLGCFYNKSLLVKKGVSLTPYIDYKIYP